MRSDDNCRAGTADGRLCHEFRGLKFCLYCGTYRCWRHLCEHLRKV